jgi:pimeloyl-ACP methyl ester carboxylesterase
VQVTAGPTSPTSPATGLADRAARIPTGTEQVRVDRYVREGRPDRFEVYIGGTIDFSPTATGEPWDLTSNVHGVAGGDPASHRATVEALAAAGAEPGAEIVVTGYSQGGLVAATMAASGDYEVAGVYTLGAPAGQVAVPSDVPWVAIEHTDDLVPALGGSWAQNDTVVVDREAFDGRPPDDSYVFPAHQIQYYLETAQLADAAGDERVVAAAEAFDRFSNGSERVESTLFEARRVPE